MARGPKGPKHTPGKRPTTTKKQRTKPKWTKKPVRHSDKHANIREYVQQLLGGIKLLAQNKKRDFESLCNTKGSEKQSQMVLGETTNTPGSPRNLKILIGGLLSHGFVKHAGEMGVSKMQYLLLVYDLIRRGVLKEAPKHKGKDRWQIVDDDGGAGGERTRLRLFLGQEKVKESDRATTFAICTCFVAHA
ncbi:MAG: hypothetical protein KF775_19615 [Cyclobacteriaceae bacterium]|nr:hypothetical protein [Cyclobacteriaceae bacterium]